MYKKFFGLREKPFNLTPDPEYFYMSSVHREALSHLLFGIEQRKGFIMITGEVGAGKTTLCRALLSSVPKSTQTALILNPSISAIELLRAINQEFGLSSTPDKSKKELLDDLNYFLLDVLSRGGNAVIIIDECQNLSPEVLEQVRMLSNLETEKEKLLQIVLIGQPELARTLSMPSLKQINDRITLRYYIGPLSLSETGDYIYHRLTVAGSHGDIRFSRSAIKLIYRFSEGLPRRINVAAERSMIFAYLKGTRNITKRIVKAAIREIKGEIDRSRNLGWRLVAMASFLLVLATAGLLSRPYIPKGIDYISRKFSMPVKISNQAGPAMGKDAKVTKTETKKINNVSTWTVPDYDRAYVMLHTLPSVARAFDTLNLHPQPDVLRYIPRPFIVCVDNGYAVVVKADKDHISVMTPNMKSVDIPIKAFVSEYKWNVMVPYKKEEGKVYQLTDQGKDVMTIQSVLYNYGYLSKKPDGFYDFETAKGVEKVQEVFGLTRDGIAGPDTFSLLEIIGKVKG